MNKELEEKAKAYANSIIAKYGDNGIPSSIKAISKLIADAYIQGHIDFEKQ